MAKSSLLLALGVAPLDLADAELHPVEVATMGCPRARGQRSPRTAELASMAAFAPAASGAVPGGKRDCGYPRDRSLRSPSTAAITIEASGVCDRSYPRAGGEVQLEHGIDETHQAPQCGCRTISHDLETVLICFVAMKLFFSLPFQFRKKADVAPYLMCMKPSIKLH